VNPPGREPDFVSGMGKVPGLETEIFVEVTLFCSSWERNKGTPVSLENLHEDEALGDVG
jgi:hypothetical protein